MSQSFGRSVPRDFGGVSLVLIQDRINDILETAEDQLRGMDLPRDLKRENPMDRLKTLSRLIDYKSSSMAFEFSSLETCVKHNRIMLEAQLDSYAQLVRDVLLLSLEAEHNLMLLADRMEVEG